jgi:4-hydroxy-tetrahydrodipicolinate reductase
MRILLIGHGKMGRLVEGLAPSYGCEVVGVVTSRSDSGAIESSGAEVAVDFSLAGGVAANFARLAAQKLDVVLGTTGWQAEEAACREIARDAGIGVIASANFAVGMHIFRRAVGEAAARFASQADVGAWIHEAHHATKKDAPSGTAMLLQKTMMESGYARPIDVSSTRAGAIPGTHVVGFDGPSDTVTLTHTVRDRSVFARGALEAARWVRGRKGWFTVEDML